MKGGRRGGGRIKRRRTGRRCERIRRYERGGIIGGEGGRWSREDGNMRSKTKMKMEIVYENTGNRLKKGEREMKRII